MQGHLGNRLQPDLVFEQPLSVGWPENKQISRMVLLMGLRAFYPACGPKTAPLWLIFMGDNVFLPPGTSFYFTAAVTGTYKSSNPGYLKTFSLLTRLAKAETGDRVGRD